MYAVLLFIKKRWPHPNLHSVYFAPAQSPSSQHEQPIDNYYLLYGHRHFTDN